METKRILIISETHLIKTFVLPTVKRLKSESNCIFDCFIVTPVTDYDREFLGKEFDKVYSISLPKCFIARIPRIRVFFGHYKRKLVAKSLPSYSVAHIHFHHHYFSYFTPYIRQKATLFYISFFGSDFNQVESFRHRHNLISVNLANAVFATNETLLYKIAEKYNLVDRKITTDILIPFIDTFDVFEQYLECNTQASAKNHWKTNELFIVCGYSASAISQHEKIIQALVLNRLALASAKIIFPMTYGHLADKTRNVVKTLLSEKKMEAEVLEEFLPLEKLQALRLAADIFIHIQRRDQMAASMLEHLAAGSVVITGKWLPYESLVKKGVFMIRIESTDDLSIALVDVLDNLDKYKLKAKINREIILNMMSWENIKKNWYKYYDLEVNV